MKIIQASQILLPNKKIDLYKWAVVACDQFTSQKDYWEKVEQITEGAPSTFNLIYPEVYLSEDNAPRIEKINATMRRYLAEDVFDTLSDSFILVERDTPYTKCRLGLIMSVDLDAYDYTPFSDAYIKATEGTIIERIPPRVKIRGNAPLELPHIMLLIDDADCSIIEPLFEKAPTLEKLYDSDLNQNGGHIRGYRVSDVDEIIEKIYALLDKDVQIKKYGVSTNFLFAVGDGNHSLATAKAHWENVKKTLAEQEKLSHPARFALVEVMNLHSKALAFEPIHRVILGAGENFVDKLAESIKGDANVTLIMPDGSKKIISASGNRINAIKQIQDFIDSYIAVNPEVKVDYVHGEKDLKEVVLKEGGIGIIMPTIEKSELFEFIIKKGVLPRKSFSMGEAVEKRYYLEAKKIVK